MSWSDELENSTDISSNTTLVDSYDLTEPTTFGLYDSVNDIDTTAGYDSIPILDVQQNESHADQDHDNRRGPAVHAGGDSKTSPYGKLI